MNRILSTILFLLFAFTFHQAKAETWDEPWQKEIIQKSDYFVLGKIIDVNDSSLKVQIIENFGKETIEDEIIIDNFFMVKLTSSSGHGVHFILDKDEIVYLFLKQNGNKNYSLPTPTSGFAIVTDDGNVKGTYRHSYHQTLISKEIYELTYKNIWSYYKENKIDKVKINKFINAQLKSIPSGFDEHEINQFFLQHTALETAYLLDLKPAFKLVEKFANSDNYHSRISAIQLMGNINSTKSKDFLLATLTNEKFTNFEKVIAIWSLKKIGDKTYINKVKNSKNELSDEVNGFGGNIMDPRVGTYFPSPQQAAEKL